MKNEYIAYILDYLFVKYVVMMYKDSLKYHKVVLIPLNVVLLLYLHQNNFLLHHILIDHNLF